jgi:hypothetical protein
MNSQEAKRLLEMLRPGGEDSADPQFTKALQQAESDPELGRWLAEQKTFDQGIARSLKGVPVPAELRNTLLAIVPKEQEKENVLRPLFPLWSRWRDWRVTTAAAAIVLLASFGFVLAQYNKPTAFSEFRRELLKEAWGSEAHLEFRSTSFARVRQWLFSQGIADVKLPAGFKEMHVQGCQIVEVGTHRVPMFCLVEGSKHLHLFVVEGAQLAGLPQRGLPDFERCGPLKTAAWQQGDRTYLLSGLKSYAFVTKFRKAGRWTLWG